MQLDEAVGRIGEIRAQLARTETFRGLRSLSVACSGLIGLAVALLQADVVPSPAEQVGAYVELWVGAALLSLLVGGTEIGCRWWLTASPLNRRLTFQALQQFAPCLVAGSLLALIVPRSAPQVAWMLPGLWGMVFGLGIFSCLRLLPRAMAWVAGYYLAAGAVCLVVGSGPQEPAPWMMAATFGVGQFLAAGVLYVSLEKRHDTPAE